MTQTYFPFDAGAGANVTESQWSSMGQYWRGSGVIATAANYLEVYGDSSGMQAKVKTGKAWIKGHYFESDAVVTLAVSAADPSNPRWDRVVVHLDWTGNTIALTVLTGTAGASPTAPTLTQSASIWEIPLARVYVPAGASTIRVGDVVDERVYDYENLINWGRLSLIRNDAAYAGSVSAVTPSSTDTTGETVTFSATPGWPTGQGVQIVTTVGGLTAGTLYYVYTADGLTYSFHTNYADSIAQANKVNLTANVTNALCPAELYWISQNATIALSFIGATASKPFDVFLYDNTGIPTLETLVWTSDTARATAIVKVNGRWTKSGDPTRLYLGTIRTTSTAGQVLDSVTQRYVRNYYNRVLRNLFCRETTSHTYNGAARKWNNSDTNNLLEFVSGVAEDAILVMLGVRINAGADASIAAAYSYLDGAQMLGSDIRNYNIQPMTGSFQISTIPAVGYHSVQAYELGNHASSTFVEMTHQVAMLG